MNSELIHTEFRTTRAHKTELGEWRLEALGAPFGGHIDGKDLQGDYFSSRTEFGVDVGDRRPVYYFHGETPFGQRDLDVDIVGRAEVTRIDDRGVWFDVLLDQSKKYAERLWKSAIRGDVRASSGAINYLVRRSPSGEVLSWPVGELTLVDQGQGRTAANQLAVVNLKAGFNEIGVEMPETFIEGGDSLGVTVTQEDKDSETVNQVAAAMYGAAILMGERNE